MDINKFAEEASKLADSKGLWGNSGIKTVASLIHCEWSEALQEDRANRPMYYHRCSGNVLFEYDACEDETNSECYYKVRAKEAECNFRDAKQEGIAVELVDGIILICSTISKYGCIFEENDTDRFIEWVPTKWTTYPLECIGDLELPVLVYHLHRLVSQVSVYDISASMESLQIAAGLAWIWVELRGLDPEKILMEKHKYNQTREYKHGRKF